MALGWESVLTLVGAFGAASTAQFFSHSLTLKREEEKYKKEQYQNFYSPLVFKVANYIASAGLSMDEKTSRYYTNNNSKGKAGISLEAELPQPEILFKQIISLLEKNLKYANANFIKVFEKFKSQELTSSNNTLNVGYEKVVPDDVLKWREEHDLEERMKICEEFLIAYLQLSEDIEVLSSTVKYELTNLLIGVKMFNLAMKYNFKHTSFALLHFTGVFYRGRIFLSPGIQDSITETEKKVKNALESCLEHTGYEEDFYVYESFILLIEDVIDILIGKGISEKFQIILKKSLERDKVEQKHLIKLNQINAGKGFKIMEIEDSNFDI